MSPAKKEFIIVSVVCNEYHISVDDLSKPSPPSRQNDHQEPKLVAIYLLKKHTFYTMSRMAPIVGYAPTFNRQYAQDWVDSRMVTNDEFKRRVNKLEAILPQIFNIHK